MAKISLRAYNREIETLIEHGNHDQAIAHCRHILSIYNKHIFTYRLLGKAYLESQRFGDAADIFQRVLSTLPDDFISHVGMSIIREDEGNLDEAIWHMERAYEIQPANNAIQRELQRLYGKRDGIEPPKIRLTRAALARMYIKGELYEQAINELRPTQDPISHRPDLYVLLAQVYYLTGKRVDAAQVCNQLIKRLPFCFEANRILTAILTETDRTDEAKSYRQRLIVLDPYAAHTSPTSPIPDQVPDTAVSLEKLEWNPETSPSDMLSQPEWASSLGVEIEDEHPEQESLPEWLDSIEEQPVSADSSDEEFPEPPMLSEDSREKESASGASLDQPSEADSIPSWMKEAGWEAASDSIEEISESFPTDEPDEASEELAPAELPDWLHAIAPSDDTIEDVVSTDKEYSEIEDESLPVETSALPWLEETPPGPSDTVASWLEEKEPQLPDAAELDLDSVEPIEIPEWLQDLKQEEIPPIPAGYNPDQELEETLEDETLEPVEDRDRDLSLDLPVDKLAMGAAAGIVAAIHDEDEQLDQEIDETILESESEVSDEDELPDWLHEPSAEPSIDQTESDDLEEETQHAMEFEATEEMVDQISDRMDVADPDTILQPEFMEADSDVEEIESADAEIDAELPLATPVETVDSQVSQEIEEVKSDLDDEYIKAHEQETISRQEEDEAFAWLEGLAVKQGVDEALLLQSDDQIDTPPDWVQAEEGEVSIDSETETDQYEPEKVLDEGAVPVSEEQTEDLPEWLKGIQPSDQAAVEPEIPDSTEIPDWLKQAQLTSEEPSELEMETSDSDQEAALAEDIPDWLKGSAVVAGVETVASTRDEDISTEAVESIHTDDVPEWLKDSETEQSEPEEELGIEAMEEFPSETHDDKQEEIDKELISDEEMLFGPAAVREVNEEPAIESKQEESSIEEGAITEEDTKPIRTSPADEVPIPPAITDSTPVEALETSEKDAITDEAREEDLPDWIKDLSEELELPADAAEPIESKETPIEEDEKWAPDIIPEEVSLEADRETIPAPSEVSDDVSTTEPELESAESLDDEDAFAWLEGLAAKHGAEEAMLLEPEDRQETPPEWVLAEGKAQDSLEEPALGEEQSSEVEVIDIDRSEMPDSIAEEPDQDIQVSTAASGAGAILDEIAEEVEGDETITEPEAEKMSLEPPVMEDSVKEEAEVDETVPELPPWLAGIEEESADTETPEWKLISELDEQEDRPVLDQETPARVNLNQAGLVELENLPGVGFIKAQAIIEYRESVGHFSSIEDLQSVSGIGPALIEEIKDQVIIEVPEEEVLEIPTDEHQLTLIQARNALIEGDINASLEHYNKLIQSRQMQSDVIQDLNEALYRFPVDIGIWQALGDVFMRSGHIQDALDAYTKAEELLR